MAPCFPPDVEGLGEFAHHLGNAFLKQYGIQSDFIIWRAQKEPEAAATFTSHQVQRLSQQNKRMLVQALDARLRQYPSPTLLLHYTSYSYSGEGLAWWLPDVLRRFKSQGGRVVCFFHELYAKKRFPSKTWLGSWLQKRIFRQIVALSDAAITSNQGYLEEIKSCNQRAIPLVLAGIGSNIGELTTTKPFTARSRRLVIFGLWITRLLLYERHMEGIKKLAKTLEIDEIADVGNIDEHVPMLYQAKSELGAQMKIYGRLPASKISELLADSLVGIANYNYSLRSKSGVVAAYQSHGLPCVLFPSVDEISTGELSDDCLSSDQIFRTPKDEIMELLQKASAAGFADYQASRSFESVARKIEPLLWA